MRLVAIAGLLLSLLIAVAAVLVVRNMQQPETEVTAPSKNQIVVAAENLRFGQRLTTGNLKLIDWYADSLPDGALRSLDEIKFSSEGPYLLSSLAAGAPLLKGRFTSDGQKPGLSSLLSPGSVAVTMQVNTITGVAGFVLPNERVDILLTRKTQQGSFADIVLEDIRVLAVDSAIDTGSGSAIPAKSVTFEVTREQAQKLILAQGLGSISLALRNLSDAPYSPARRVNDTDVITGPRSSSQNSTSENSLSNQGKSIELEKTDSQLKGPDLNATAKDDAPGEPAEIMSVRQVRVLRGLASQSYTVPERLGQ